MPLILVEYRVPVEVVVDLDSRSVLSVNVWDVLFEPPGWFSATDGSVPSSEEIAQARRIAEAAEWPCWEVGY